MKERPIVRGTIILTAGGLVSRVIGALYRIVLIRLIGVEGLGLYQLPFPLFLLGISIATLGLPVGLSKVVADAVAAGEPERAHRMYLVSLRFTLVGAAVVATGLFMLAPVLASNLLTDERVLPVIRAVAIALFFSCISGTMRGYFHGRQDMVPSATSQVVEQIVRTAGSLLLAWWMLPRGPAWAAMGAMLGVALGEVASIVTLAAWIRLRRTTAVDSRAPRDSLGGAMGRSGVGELLSLSVPLALTRTLYSVERTVEVGLIPRRLEVIGYTAAQATAAYGQLTGIAVSLLFLPTVFIFPLTTALLPAVAEMAVRTPETLSRRIGALTGVALGLGAAAAVGFYSLGGWLAGTVYGVPEAGRLIRLLAVVAPVAYLEFISTSILNGLGKTRRVFEHTLAGVFVRLSLIQLLVSNPALGVGGVLWAYAAGHLVTAFMNLASIRCEVGTTAASMR